MFAIKGANAVLATVAKRTAKADFDSAARLLDDALVEIDRQEAEQQEAEHRKQVLFLEAAIKQHTLRRDVVGVVSRIERLVALDHTSDRLTSFRAQYDRYLANGEAKGVNFFLLIAAECARRMIATARQDELGAALGTFSETRSACSVSARTVSDVCSKPSRSTARRSKS